MPEAKRKTAYRYFSTEWSRAFMASKFRKKDVFNPTFGCGRVHEKWHHATLV